MRTRAAVVAAAALAAGLSLLAVSAAAAPAAIEPLTQRATKRNRCVEDTASMRRNHMRFLEHQRDATVRGGVRGARHSLKGCIDCHASRATGSVAQAATDFCVSCHAYAAVKIDCFDCHATKPAKAAAAAAAAAAAIATTAAKGATP